MPSQKEEVKQQPPQKPTCFWIGALVVILLFALAYFAIYQDKKVFGSKSSMRGGKWVARGGCGCMPPK